MWISGISRHSPQHHATTTRIAESVATGTCLASGGARTRWRAGATAHRQQVAFGVPGPHREDPADWSANARTGIVAIK